MILTKFAVFQQIFITASQYDVTEIRRVGAVLMHADRRIDRR